MSEQFRFFLSSTLCFAIQFTHEHLELSKRYLFTVFEYQLGNNIINLCHVVITFNHLLREMKYRSPPTDTDAWTAPAYIPPSPSPMDMR